MFTWLPAKSWMHFIQACDSARDTTPTEVSCSPCISDQMVVMWSADWGGDQCHLPLWVLDVWCHVWEIVCGKADTFGSSVCDPHMLLEMINMVERQEDQYSSTGWITPFWVLLGSFMYKSESTVYNESKIKITRDLAQSIQNICIFMHTARRCPDFLYNVFSSPHVLASCQKCLFILATKFAGSCPKVFL